MVVLGFIGTMVAGIWWYALIEGGSFEIINDTNIALDESALAESTVPLIDDRRANVTLYLVIGGGEDDLWQRVEADGLGSRESGIDTSEIVFYQSLDPTRGIVALGSYFEDDATAGDLQRTFVAHDDPGSAFTAVLSAAGLTLFFSPFALMMLGEGVAPDAGGSW